MTANLLNPRRRWYTLRMLNRPRKSWRLQSALALFCGLVLLAFEIRRIQAGDDEAWFWICVAGMIVLLGLAGVVQRQPPGDEL